jgi:hypothetical protein
VLIELLQPQAILLKNDNPQRELEGLSMVTELAYGELPEQLIIEENNAQFQIDIVGGQKTGWLCTNCILSLTKLSCAFCSAKAMAPAEASTQVTCSAPFIAAGIPQAPA